MNSDRPRQDQLHELQSELDGFRARLLELSSNVTDERLGQLRQQLDGMNQQLAALAFLQQGQPGHPVQTGPSVTCQASCPSVNMTENIPARPAAAPDCQANTAARPGNRMERFVGQAVMGVLASLLVLIGVIALGAFVIPMLPPGTQMLIAYALGLFMTRWGLAWHRKQKYPTFSLAIAGCGTVVLFLSILVSTVLWDGILDNLVISYVQIVIWTAGVCHLGVKRSRLFEIIGYMGITIGSLFGFGTHMLSGSFADDGMSIALVVFFASALASYMFVFSHSGRMTLPLGCLLITFGGYLCIASLGMALREYSLAISGGAAAYTITTVMMIIVAIGGLFAYVVLSDGYSGRVLICDIIASAIMFLVFWAVESCGLATFSLYVLAVIIILLAVRCCQMDRTSVFLALGLLMSYAFAMDMEYCLLLCAAVPLLIYFAARASGQNLLTGMCVGLLFEYLFFVQPESGMQGLIVMKYVLLCVAGLTMVLVEHYRPKPLDIASGGVYGFVMAVAMYLMFHAVVLLLAGLGIWQDVQYSGMLSLLPMPDPVGSIWAPLLCAAVLGFWINLWRFRTWIQNSVPVYVLRVCYIINVVCMGLFFVCIPMLTGHLVLHWIAIVMAVAGFSFSVRDLLETRFGGWYVGIKFLALLFNIMASWQLTGVITSIAFLFLAVAAVLIGFRYQYKTLRLFGLALSCLSTAKFVLVDVNYDSGILKATAFVFGGLLCFGISFLYSKADRYFAGRNAAAEEENES